MRATFLAIHDAVVEIARWAAMTALVALVVLVVAAVVVRYFGIFGGSLHWVDESVRFVMIWMVMLGSVVALDRGAHLAVALLPDALGPRGRLAVIAMANLLAAAFTLILAWKGWELSQRTMRQVSPSLGLPMGYVYLAIPISAAMMTVQLLAYTVMGRTRDPESSDANF
jgi:TRAP-type C4-dicarboxylate transport system permease small subunit